MFGFCGNNEDVLKEEMKRKEQIEEEEETKRTKQENREMKINAPMSVVPEAVPSSPLPTVGVSTWRDTTSPTLVITVPSPPPTSSSFPEFTTFLDSGSGEPSTPKPISATSEGNPVLLNSAIKMLQQQLDEEKRKNKSLKEQMEKESVVIPISFAPFSVDKPLRLGESFGQFFGMKDAGPPPTNDKPLVEESTTQTPPPPISSPFSIPSIPMSFFGATTVPPFSVLNADNEKSLTEQIPPASPSFYSNMMPSIPFYGTTTESASTVSAPPLQSQGPVIDVKVPTISPALTQSEAVPSPPISSPFSIPHMNPLSYFGTATENESVSTVSALPLQSQGPVIDVKVPTISPALTQSEAVPSPPISSPFSINPLSYFGTAAEQPSQPSPVVVCPPVSVRDLGTIFDTEVVRQSPAGKASSSSGSPAKTPNMDPIRIAVEAVLEIHSQEDRARIVELEGLLSVANASNEESERMLNSAREDLQACERQIAAAGETDADRLQRIAHLEGLLSVANASKVESEQMLNSAREDLRACERQIAAAGETDADRLQRIAHLEGLLSVANASKVESEQMLNSAREDLRACERQIAAAGETDANRLQRIAELDARTRNYQSRITELESLASTDREQLVDLQTRLEELVTEKRKRDEMTGVNPLIQKQRDVDRKQISRLSKLLDETMTALNETHKACEVAEAQVHELQAGAKRTDSISMTDSGSTTRESAATITDADNAAAAAAAAIKVHELEQQLELLQSSQASADLCLIQMDEQRKLAKDEAALLRAQLSESHSKLALMELQHQQLVDATMDKPPFTTTPSALRSRSSSSTISGANTPPRPPFNPSSTAFSQPSAPATPATPGPDDGKRMDRVRIINAGLLRLALDAEFQEDIQVVVNHCTPLTISSSSSSSLPL